MNKKHAIIALCTFVLLSGVYLAFVFMAEPEDKVSEPMGDETQVNNDSIVTDSLSLN